MRLRFLQLHGSKTVDRENTLDRKGQETVISSSFVIVFLQGNVIYLNTDFKSAINISGYSLCTLLPKLS